MAAKSILLLCASASIIGTAFGQFFGREPVIGAGFPSPFPGRPFESLPQYDGYGIATARPPTGCGFNPLAPQSGLAASYGGGLSVTSSSPIAPTGLSVTSENDIEGTVTIAGQLPFLGAVATDGTFATAGAGAVSYGCGDGSIGIVAETPITPATPTYGAGIPSYGYGANVPGYKGFTPLGGFGCGSLY